MWPGLFQTVEDIATDDAISVNVYKEAIRDNADVNIVIDITNLPKK